MLNHIKIKKVETRAVITRADGTVEDLGVIGVCYGSYLDYLSDRVTAFFSALLLKIKGK